MSPADLVAIFVGSIASQGKFVASLGIPFPTDERVRLTLGQVRPASLISWRGAHVVTGKYFATTRTYLADRRGGLGRNRHVAASQPNK